MIQPSLLDWTPPVAILGDRNGETFDRARDGARLNGQSADVFRFMSDGKWHTLAEISEATGHPEASVSARLRDLRKRELGNMSVESERVCKGLWRYRLGSGA